MVWDIRDINEVRALTVGNPESREQGGIDVHQKVRRRYDYIPPLQSSLPIPVSCEVRQHNCTNRAISSVPWLHGCGRDEDDDVRYDEKVRSYVDYVHLRNVDP